MRYSTTAIVLAAMTIGEAVAGPAHAHAHLHRKVHEKKDVDWSTLDWADMDINWAAAYSSGMAEKAGATATAAPVATTAASVVATDAAVAAPATTSDSSLVGDVTTAVGSGVEELFAGLVGVSNLRNSFGSPSASSGTAGDSYVGNYGEPYGANIIKVDSTSGYDFTATFVNTQSSTITVNCWNKVGSDLQPLSGSALAPKDTTLTFALPAGESQVVAFQENSQVGCAQACSDIAASGAYATTWMEANFLSTGSGMDVSAIMNAGGNNYNMSITSKENDCQSTMTENMWLTATDPVGGSDGSCYIPGSTAALTVTMGGTV